MSDRFNRWVAVAIALVTAAAAVISFLQFDAGGRDDRAGRDSKRYSLQAFGRQVSGSAQYNFDVYRAYQSFDEFRTRANSARTHENEQMAAIYDKLAEDTRPISPLLSPKYFPKDASDADFARYQSDVYEVETAGLNQKSKAAGVVKDAWDSKANIYVVQLTLLAVALFLFGLAATVATSVTGPLFVATGVAVALWAVVWAGVTCAQPVFDLRDVKGAIEHYATGIGLKSRAQSAEGKEARALSNQAVAEFDAALAVAPDYVEALVARADSYDDLAQPAKVVENLEQARKLAPDNTAPLGQLAIFYYQLGEFDKSLAAVALARETRPREAWLVFQGAIDKMAQGKVDEAKADYKAGNELIAAQLDEARQAGQEPPSDLVQAVADASVDLINLQSVIDDKQGSPPPDKVQGGAKTSQACDQLSDQLDSDSTSLEYTGKLPGPSPSCKIEDFTFTETSDDGEDDKPEAETFADTVSQISVHFDYARMKNGQHILFRIYQDGTEMRSWRMEQTWDGDAEGAYEQVLSPGYTESFTFPEGEYLVELYVDFHKVQYGAFTVKG